MGEQSTDWRHRRPPRLGAAGGSSLLPQPQKPARLEATEQRARSGAGTQHLPPRPGKEMLSEPDLPKQGRGASPGGSHRLQSLSKTDTFPLLHEPMI